MKVYFASDHAGFELKGKLMKVTAQLGFEPVDAGAFEREEGDDYPDYVIPAVKAAVASSAKAVVMGGSGNGEAIAANKVKGARAAVCFDAYTTEMARKDNDANVLALGARTQAGKKGAAEKILKIFLTTKFSGAARHKRRIAKIEKYEGIKG